MNLLHTPEYYNITQLFCNPSLSLKILLPVWFLSAKIIKTFPIIWKLIFQTFFWTNFQFTPKLSIFWNIIFQCTEYKDFQNWFNFLTKIVLLKNRLIHNYDYFIMNEKEMNEIWMFPQCQCFIILWSSHLLPWWP